MKIVYSEIGTEISRPQAVVLGSRICKTPSVNWAETFAASTGHLSETLKEKPPKVRSRQMKRIGRSSSSGNLLVALGRSLRPRSEERRVGKECRSRWSP